MTGVIIASMTRRTLTIATLLAATSCLADPGAAITWQPRKLTNGSPVLFQIQAPSGVQSLTAEWLAHDLSFYRLAGLKYWYALGGVPLQTSAGSYQLKLTETLRSGKVVHLQQTIKISKASYPRITVTVAKQFTEPNAAQLATIAADKGVKEKIFASVTAKKLWLGPFAAPVSAPVSDLFGTERVFNHEVQSRHQGLDYAVPAGTPVRAVNHGIVLLARPMYFEGNCAVIDHGQGLLSLYLHLSEFKVKEGDEVREGEVIALSGGTGRATGAHLHLAVRWQGVYLNPALLMKLPIPPE